MKMGSSFIITKSMLNEKGRKLMLDFYDIIHDDYCLETSSEFREQRKYWDENVVDKYRKLILKNMSVFKIDDKYKKVNSNFTHISPELKEKNCQELVGKDLLEYIKDKIRDKTIELEFVFMFLKGMDEKLNLNSILEFESNEDLFSLKSAFLKAYELFYHSGKILD